MGKNKKPDKLYRSDYSNALTAVDYFEYNYEPIENLKEEGVI